MVGFSYWGNMVSCPNCGTKSNDIICEKCSYLVDQKDFENFFSLFSIGRTLSVSKDKLESRYYYLSKKIHPDLFANKSDEQKKLSIKYSSLLNQGYKTLKSPFGRAKYFLKINNSEHFNKEIPKSLLRDIFEIQDLLDSDYPDKEDEKDLKTFQIEMEEKEQYLLSRLEQVYRDYRPNENKDATVSEINSILSEYNYIIRLINQIEEKLESIE